MIYLLTKQRRLRTLMRSLCGAVLGLFVAAAVAPPAQRANSQHVQVRVAIFIGGMVLGAAIVPITFAMLAGKVNRSMARSDGADSP